jgi:quercetin dioxygenase-like cupin family protein
MKTIALLALLLSIPAAEQLTAPIPAAEVTLRKQIYEDARVRVFLLDIPPGHATVLHRHDRDLLTVFVSGGKTRAVFNGGAPVDDTFAVGDVRFRAAGFTHSTENLDSVDFLAVIFEFAESQGERVALTRAARRTCAAGDDKACVDEKPLLCTARLCVDEVIMAPRAVMDQRTATTDCMLVPVSGYSLSEQIEGGAMTVHTKSRGEVELIPGGSRRRLTNATSAPAHSIIVTFH